MSTYSPDLRIELITTGDQAGTWGTTTNTNLGTLIEGAIAGYTTVSVIASAQAFTALNGAADEARMAMIRLTTTTGADFAVYAPPNSKQYIIWNNSGHTATIYNSTVLGNTTAAGTGVAIADGDKVVVFTNGTNFYTVKTNNVTGTVAIANGGTGQTTANAAFNALAPSQASANGKYLKSDGTNTSWDAIDLSTSDISGVLPVVNGGTGVTTSTGSGSNVLSNSPTLVTPALGTPASGTMTNVTGLPLTTGVTGTLPVANGGTGVTTSTGSGSVVLSNSPTLVTPALGTPASGNFSTGTFTWPTFNQNTSGQAGFVANSISSGTGLSGGSFNGSSPVTFAIDSTVATLTGTQTLTNKTISGATNTLSNIGNSSLTNSAITINGNSVSLGGSTTVTASNPNALTIGTGLSGTSYNGSAAVTVAIDSTVATLTGLQTLTNKSISGASNTLTNIPNSALTNAYINLGSTYAALGSTTNSFSMSGEISGGAVSVSGSTVATDGMYRSSAGVLGFSTNSTARAILWDNAFDFGVSALDNNRFMRVNNPGSTAAAYATHYVQSDVAYTMVSAFSSNYTSATYRSKTMFSGRGTGATGTIIADFSTGTNQILFWVGTTASPITAATVNSAGSWAFTNATAPTKSQGDNTTSVATTAYVQNMGLGLSQTWTTYNSGGARSVNSSFTWASLTSIYTNSTGKPIGVSVGRYGGNGYATTVWVDAVPVLQAQVDQYGGAESMGVVIVQPGSQYAVSVSGGVWCNYWYELR